MSQENVEVVQQLIEAFNRRDLAAMTRNFDPEIEWTPGGPAAVERAVYQGRDEVSDGFGATWETWELFHLEEHQVRDLGDPVLWLGRARMRGGDASHVEFDQEFAVHLLVRGGKIVRIQGFLTWHEALEAAGLSESTMSQEKVEIVRRIFDRWATGDFGAGLADLDPGVVFVVRPPVPEAVKTVGPDGIRKYMRGFLDNWDRYAVEARTLRAADDIVVAHAVQHGEGKASRIEMEQEFFMLFTFRGGRIVRIESVLNEREALEAAGLRE
jgi:ketosteroid isomerase-like protein